MLLLDFRWFGTRHWLCHTLLCILSRYQHIYILDDKVGPEGPTLSRFIAHRSPVFGFRLIYGQAIGHRSLVFGFRLIYGQAIGHRSLVFGFRLVEDQAKRKHVDLRAPQPKKPQKISSAPGHLILVWVDIYIHIYIDSSLVALILKGKALLTSLQNYSVCASLCATMCHSVSLCVTVCHCVSLCTYRKLSISKRQKATSAIRRRNDSNSFLSKRAGKKMQKSRFSLSEAHGCRHMSTHFSVLL